MVCTGKCYHKRSLYSLVLLYTYLHDWSESGQLPQCISNMHHAVYTYQFAVCMSVSIHKFVCSSSHVVVCMYQFACTSLHNQFACTSLHVKVYTNQFACTSLHVKVYTNQFACTLYQFACTSLHISLCLSQTYVCANIMYLGLIVYTCYDVSALYIYRHKNIYNITCT